MSREIEVIGAKIVEPYIHIFARRYSNNYDYVKGSRYVNETPCPLCIEHLKNNCATCPMDQAFGMPDGIKDNSGCKVWIRSMWGPITFGDFPDKIIRNERVNYQLERMRMWVRRVFGI